MPSDRLVVRVVAVVVVLEPCVDLPQLLEVVLHDGGLTTHVAEGLVGRGRGGAGGGRGGA